MTETNRKPVYSTEQTHRVISVPSNGWAIQKLTSKDRSKTNDPWKTIRKPMNNYQLAVSTMKGIAGDKDNN